MRTISKAFVLAMAVSGIAVLGVAQTAQKPAFEVVSIKPSMPGSSFAGGGVDGDRYVMRGATLKLLVQVAYRTAKTAVLREDQVIGGPNWIDSDRFDVEAKAGCAGGAISNDQIDLMVQSLLEDRFQLKVHYEKRDLPVYDLVVAKGGPKLKMSADQTPALRPAVLATLTPCAPPPAGNAVDPPAINSHAIPRGILLVMKNVSDVTMTGSAVPISDFVTMLQGQAGRLVIDKTSMNELFDINLKFSNRLSPSTVAEARNPSAQSDGGQPALAESDVPGLFTAIEEQLGLGLESAKAPLDVLVIDSAQRPTEN